MDIVVVSKPGCHRCILAKDKLKRLGLTYREGGLAELAAPKQDTEFPVILIDGVAYQYSAAMRHLKESARA